MLNEKLRNLVETLDQKHNDAVRSIYTFGKVTPITTKAFSEVKGVQREIVKVENEQVLKNT
tara:strand:+ start:123 stop:305 length:183 start_codon:yes stop_codon:yes gene_type:complete